MKTCIISSKHHTSDRDNSQKMTLESWLNSRAGLAGKKLQAAVSQCDDNFVESVSDLRRLAADKEQFMLVFPQGMIRTDILKALKTNAKETEDVKPDENMNPPTKPTAGSSEDLPSGFRFHYFVSHRKNHSKHDNVTEIQVLFPFAC